MPDVEYCPLCGAALCGFSLVEHLLNEERLAYYWEGNDG